MDVEVEAEVVEGEEDAEEEEGGGGRRRTTLIKSYNPHLAVGNKNETLKPPSCHRTHPT